MNTGMRNKLLITLLILFALTPLLSREGSGYYQASDTCTEGQALVLDVTNKRYKCNNVTLVYRSKNLNVNQTNTDLATISGLPSRYIVRRFTFDNASATPTSSTVSLRTASGGGGTAIVNAQALVSLSASTTFLDSTLAVTTSVQTSTSLVIRAVAAAGGAATVDATLEITPLP